MILVLRQIGYRPNLLQVFEGSGGVALADGDNLGVQHEQVLHLLPEGWCLAVGHCGKDTRCGVVRLHNHMPADIGREAQRRSKIAQRGDAIVDGSV